MLRNVAGYFVVVPTGEASVEFNGMINLNESGAFLWNKLSEGATEDELVEALTSEYEVDDERARADVELFVKKMREAKLVEE